MGRFGDDSISAFNAASAISNDLVEPSKRGFIPIDTSPVLRLGEFLFDISQKGSSKIPYLDLQDYIDSLREPVQNYFFERFHEKSKMEDLAKKTSMIGNQMQEYQNLPKFMKEKLAYFCLELSQKGFDRCGWQYRRLAG